MKSLRIILLLVLLITAIAACDSDNGEKTSDGKTKVTLFMSYVPSVQFAPVYVAYEKGYFAEEGIELDFENSFNEIDGVDRIAVNNLQFAILSGEQILLGRNVGKPLVYVMEWYHRFPVGVVVPADSDIETPDDLRGRKVSLPFFQGASYIGLRALLESADLGEDDLELQEVGFDAPAVMCERQVEAATVYIANEPLTISQCYDVRVIEISDYANLVSNGLVTNEKTIKDKPDLVRGMVQALQRGIADTIANPDEAFELALKHVSDLPAEQHATQRQVLLNSIELWRSEEIGATNPAAWERTQQILIDMGLLPEALDNLSAGYTNEFLSDVSRPTPES